MSTKKTSDFDVCLGRVVKSKRVKAGLTRAALSATTGIPEANLKRREAGVNEITVSELERIGQAVGRTSAQLVAEALEDYGGLTRLLEEHEPTSVQPTKVTGEDNIRHLDSFRPRLGSAADTNPRADPKE